MLIVWLDNKTYAEALIKLLIIWVLGESAQRPYNVLPLYALQVPLLIYPPFCIIASVWRFLYMQEWWILGRLAVIKFTEFAKNVLTPELNFKI